MPENSKQNAKIPRISAGGSTGVDIKGANYINPFPLNLK
jgi:hypothetical protein